MSNTKRLRATDREAYPGSVLISLTRFSGIWVSLPEKWWRSEGVEGYIDGANLESG